MCLWTEARTPTGVIVPLASPGTDELGRSGLPGEVNRHFFERFGAAILISVIDGAVQAKVQSSGNGTVIYNPSTSTDVITEVLKSTVNIPPTVVKPQGDRIQVFVARDLDFRSVYELRPAASPEARTHGERAAARRRGILRARSHLASAASDSDGSRGDGNLHQSAGEAYVETREGWRCVPLPFASFEWCQGLAKLVANSTKQRIDAESPLLSAALPGGERIQIVLPPATTPGTVAITIRRPADELWTLEELHAKRHLSHHPSRE